MSRFRSLRKRPIHAVKTQENYCIRSKINLATEKWDECFEKKIGGKFKWAFEIKRNRTLKTFVKILKC